MAAPLSGWATMRDCAIVDFLANRPKSEGPISKTDDKLFNKLRASFKHVGLDDSELPPYMNNLASEEEIWAHRRQAPGKVGG